MADLATAYLRLVPSLKGAKGTIESELSGISGEKAGGVLGDTMGEGLMGKIGGIASKAAGMLGAAMAAKGAFDFGKAAFDSYADFQQLSGGVEKLFGDTAKVVQANADSAFATMGLSSNEYMSQVTSFSAALIDSLDGDTEKAAGSAQKAMKSMSDNASIFGTDVSSVQNAYQGFAKQNYTMLDNLKLGYGGTAAEMARLVKDSGVLGKAADDLTAKNLNEKVSFAQIVDAIEAVQQKQGIAGNAAAEASKTLSGSIEATKAAWANLVTELGKPDADIGARIADMLKAVMGEGGEGGLLRNVTSEILTIAKNIVVGLGGAIVQGIPQLVMGLGQLIDSGVQFLITQGPTIATNAAQAFMGLIEGVTANGPGVVENISGIIGSVVQWLVENGPALLQAALQMFAGIGKAILDHGPEILGNLAKTIGSIVSAIIAAVPQILDAGVKFVGGLITGTSDEGKKLREWFADLPGNLLAALGDLGSFLLDAGKQIIQGLWDGLTSKFTEVQDWVGGIGQWIADHKGPKAYDLKLLVPNAEWIMQGFEDSLKAQIPALEATVGGISAALQDSLSNAYGQRRPMPAYAPRTAAPGGSGWADVESAVNGLRGDMGHLGIYLDGNKLVGGIAARMDRALVV